MKLHIIRTHPTRDNVYETVASIVPATPHPITAIELVNDEVYVHLESDMTYKILGPDERKILVIVQSKD